MKLMKWIPVLTAVAMLAACAPKAPKVLVLYYSQSSNTRTVATEIATRLNADIEEILPTVPYDGTYMETIERSRNERESGTLPEIQPLQANLADYDIVFLGYPIWFGTYALPVGSLLAQVDLTGKKVVPFCTFGSGGLDASCHDLAEHCPGAEVLPGYGVRAARIDAVPKEIDRFLKVNGYLEGEAVKLEEFPAQHEVTEEEAAIFDAAVGDYPMIHAKAATVASRALPDGTEYLFTAFDLPREGVPAPAPDMAPRPMKVYVTVEEGQAPVFTQVVR